MGDDTEGTALAVEPAIDPEVATPRRRLPRFPALDGLRGVAIGAVVVFDTGLRLAKGGHLGIATVFGITGFLATASLLSDHSWAVSWVRRTRRVVVPALVALAIACVFGVTAASARQRHDLAGDGLAALASVANWRFIATHQGFGPATSQSSPVRQFWAFSVSAQVLLVLSLLIMLIIVVWRGRRTHLAAVLSVLTVASVGAALALHHSPARVFYGTDTRAAELLIGALVAIAIFDPRITIRLAMPGPVRDTINVVGVLAALALCVAWVSIGPNNKIAVDGGLLVVALLSAAAVVACVVPDGPLSWLLSTTPFRLLGRIAIALFLVHWPIYVWVSRQTTPFRGDTLVAVRLGAALVAAIVVQLAAEWVLARSTGAREPGHRLSPTGWVGLLGVIAMVIALVVITTSGPSHSTVAAAGPTTTADTGPPPTVAFFGDALASTLAESAKAWGERTGKIEVVDGVASPACGIDRDQVVHAADGSEVPLPAQCSTWDTQWSDAVTAHPPDIAVVVTGLSEVDDHRPLNDPTYAGPGDSGYDYQLYLLMHKAVDLLAAHGTKVIWLNLPKATSGAATDDKRVAAFNHLLTTLAQERPGELTVVDLAHWVAANGGPGSEPGPDGWGAAAANHIVTEELAPQIAAVWRAIRGTGASSTTSTTAPAAPTSSIQLPTPPAGVTPEGSVPKEHRATTSTTTHRKGKKGA